MKRFIPGMNSKASYSVFRTLIIVFFVVFAPLRALAKGWTPTDGGLVVDLKPTDQILLSVMVDDDNNPATPDREYFVQNYNRYTGGYFKYTVSDTMYSFLKLIPLSASATKAPEMAVWTVDTALTRISGSNNYALGGIAYTMWNDDKTIRTGTSATASSYQFYGYLTNDIRHKDACDVVFVIPTDHDEITSFDPNNTLGRNAAAAPAKGRFNGATGYNEQLGLNYREVYWLEIPRSNDSRTYTNAALVTFNITDKEKSWSAGKIKPGMAAYAYADTKHHPTTRTVFRLYILTDPINSCSSYFFAYNEQDSLRYRKGPGDKDSTSWGWKDSTAKAMTYTMDRLFCMEKENKPASTLYHTDWMLVPESDKTFYYVGYNDDYRTGSEPLGTAGAHSDFTEIRNLPMKDLAGKKAPAGAYGRMVVDTTSSVDNLGVSFEPAGYFLKVNSPSGKNVPMVKTGENEWTTLDMWTLDAEWLGYDIKTTLMTGSAFSETDPGADVAGWTEYERGSTIKIKNTETPVSAGNSGYAQITTNDTRTNGHMVFVLANTERKLSYNNNDFLGLEIPDQYPTGSNTYVIVQSPRLKADYIFDGWTRDAAGTGHKYQAGDTIHLSGATTTLYAQAHYDGTLQIALSFIGDDDKRYFMTYPSIGTFRYARARHFDDWDNTWQGMENAENLDPNYLSTFEMRHPSNEVKAYDTEHIAEGDRHLFDNEKVLDPRRYTMKGHEDSLMFYEFFAPAKDEYLGLYYTSPNTIVANNTWAGLFIPTSTKTGNDTIWPYYMAPYISGVKLKSTRYVEEDDPVNHPDSLTLKLRSNYTVPFVWYNPTENQFDGVATAGAATTFDLSAVSVADAHYIVLPDTSEVWRDTITFGYHQKQIREQVWSKLIGKQMMAVMRLGDDTVYFHPNRNKVYNTPQDLYLSTDFRLSQNFELIHDSRVSGALPVGDSVMVEDTKDYWCNNILSGDSTPIGVKDAGGNYIDIIDTFRISLSHGSISKIKEYRGRWKKGAPGLKFKGATRYRDVIVKTKTYHYGDTLTRLVLTPVQENYSFSPLKGTSQRLSFKLTKERYLQLLDVDNKPTAEKIVFTKDTTSLLALTTGSCSFASGLAGASLYFAVSTASGASERDHITLVTKSENVEGDRKDTMTVTKTVTMDGKDYNVSTTVYLTQAALAAGNELIWSVVHNGSRYFIMAVGKDDSYTLTTRRFTNRDNVLYKWNTWTALVKGSNAGDNTDTKYITPWTFEYYKYVENDIEKCDSTQLTLQTEYGINKFFAIDGSTPTLGAATAITYEYDTIYTNSNANFEEQVRLKYGANKWLKFNGTALSLTETKSEASVFSWGYLHTEYSLLNNGDYPNKSQATFAYNDDSGEDIQTRYQAYREYSTLLDNTLTYLCREEETNIANLIDGSKDWKTTFSITRTADARSFDSGYSTNISGLTISIDTATLVTTVAPSTDSPTDVKIAGKYVNIVDTLVVTLDESAPHTYRFKGDWSSFTSISDASLKIPLVRMTYHNGNFDSIVCTALKDQSNHSFPPDGKDSTFVFRLSTLHKTGSQVLDVDNNVVYASATTNVNITRDKDASNKGMHLNDKATAEVRLVDEYGNTPTWCAITAKSDTTITVKCLEDGIRSPRTAYIYLAYIVTIGGDMKFVNARLSVSQAGLFSYKATQHLLHTNGASGDEKMENGMQQVHENRRIIYYYPDEDMELPIRERSFYGWWRWYREGNDVNGVDVSDTDVPDSLWITPPRNVAKNYSFPFRKIIVDSVWVDEADHTKGKKLGRTMGRYTVFHYRSKEYQSKSDPSSKNPIVEPPTREYGEAKPTLTYVADLSNYYDNLPLSLDNKNQVDIDLMDTMPEIIEPTLSLREIFELRPWTEMAERLEGFKDTIASRHRNLKYMEDHVLMAPTGNRLLLRTEQRYNYENLQKKGHSESLLGYYMRDDNWATWSDDEARQDSMIWCGGWDADCKWYIFHPNDSTYTSCTHSITQGDDFLNVPAKPSITAGHEFDTVYYCLRSRSRKSTGTKEKDYADDKDVDGDYWFNICRYKIIYHNPNKYGPKLETKVKGVDKAIMTNDEIEQTYEVLEKLDFDYNKPGNDYMVYPHPLPWEDASYGFTYPEKASLPHNRFHDESDFPNGGEYGLINRIPYSTWWHKMEQHGGAANGYMIYCDGMSTSGQVAALKLSTNLCAGQQMYFSGYVGNPCNKNDKSDPNFTFAVQGSTDGTTWDDITEYTTGDIRPSSQWRQIFFPINYNHAKDYKHFRVRIYNVASDYDGNDFIIDDMRVFATRPPLIAYQATTKCVEMGDKDSTTQVVLRVDYQGFTSEAYNNANVYYTIQKIKGTDTSYVNMNDHYINETAKTDSVYGYIHTPSHYYDPVDEDSIFSSIDDLIYKFDTSSYRFKQGYIYENVDGVIRPVMYVVHEAKMTSDNEYKVRMSLSPKQLTSSICAMTSNLKVTSKMMLELNGEEQDEKEITGMCANTTYDISMRVKGTLYLDSVAPIELNGTCYNDWLVGGDTVYGSSLERYGYCYSDIVKVVTKILRAVPSSGTNKNQFASSLSAVDKNEMDRIKNLPGAVVTLATSDPPYDVLTNLVNNGHLILYQSKLTETIAKGLSLEYVVMPILGTGTDVIRNADVDVCPNPLYIKLTSTKGGLIPMSIGGASGGQTPVILAGSAAAASEMTVRIDSIMATVQLDSIITLRSTDDPNYLEGIHSLNLTPDKTQYPGKGEMIHLRPARTNNFVMRPGYSYTFEITMLTMLGNTNWGEDEGNCPVGTVPFTVSVVPDYLRWDPQSGENSKWNNPDNWIGITTEDKPIHENARFAPLSSSNVVIPTLTGELPYPTIPNTILSADSVKHTGFEYNKCNSIRFMPETAIGKQQNLDYTNAVIDMTMPNRKWAMRAAPIAGMISGDVYMSDADLNDVTPLWEVGTFDAAGRNYSTGNASFWLSYYSRQTINHGNGTTQDTCSANAQWSKVTNDILMPLMPAQGWAVYSRTASGRDAVVRLPKNDDIYYYYSVYGEKVEHYEHNLRDLRNSVPLGNGNAGKLAFHPATASQDYVLTNEAASEMFIFGNPTMGYIDIWGFIADNKLTASLQEEIDYLDERGEASIYRTVTKKTAEDKTDDVITNPARYLAPMHVMVLKSTSRTSLTVTLDTCRIVTDPSQVYRPAPAPRRASSNSLSKGIMTVTAINPVSPRCNSRLLLGQGYHAAILDGEDAMLTTVNIDNYTNNTNPSTPFNIYAVENNYGLSIDLRDEIQNVPLSFYMSSLPFAPTTQLWFTGVNNIDGELVLFDSYTGFERRIIDGIHIDIPTPEQNHEVRYYIRRRGFDPNDPTTPVATAIQPNELEDIPVTKIIRDGQVLILRDGHIYTTLGQKLK